MLCDNASTGRVALSGVEGPKGRFPASSDLNPLAQADVYDELALTSGHRLAHGDGACHLPTVARSGTSAQAILHRPASCLCSRPAG